MYVACAVVVVVACPAFERGTTTVSRKPAHFLSGSDRGKFVLKANHWSRNVHWDLVDMKSFGGNFATRPLDGISRGSLLYRKSSSGKG